MPHLTRHLFQLVFGGHLPPRAAVRALFEHAREVCPDCARELRTGAPRLADASDAQPGGSPPAPGRPVPAAQAREARRLRLARRWAREDLLRLLATPADGWSEMVRSARTRFRSRATIELVVEHGRELTRPDPRRAAELLAFVPELLLWTPGGLETAWGRDLAVRAEARRANALRVAGDLPAADRLFGEVRRRLAARPAADPVLYAEVASLEASLRRDQRRFAEAAELLDRAVLVSNEAGHHEGLARALIKRADVAQCLDRHEDALADLARARGLLDPEAQAHLYVLTVVGAVPTLLELGRPAEAERVLLEAEDAFAAAVEPWWALRFRHQQGQAAHAQRHHERALRLLGEARQGFIEQKLPYDAAAASLDLALVHLDRGDAAEVQRLTRQIAPIFRAVGVEREALAALRLFQQATAEDARRHLAAAQAERSRRSSTDTRD